jgi:S1-C subfamily serine protease
MDRQLHEAPDERAETGAARRIQRPRFRILNLVGYAGFVVILLFLVQDLRQVQDTNVNLQRDVTHYHSILRKTRVRIGEIENHSRASIAQAKDDFRVLNSKSDAAVLDTSRKLVRELADRERLEREKILREIAKAHEELLCLRSDLHDGLSRQERKAKTFQSIQQRWDPSILLIHSEFTYTSRNEEGEVEEHNGSGWGTGFVVTKEGHIITNKHVVQPWKFDPELCAMEAMGEVEIDVKSVKLAAWPSGTPCMNDERKLLLDCGFNNSKLKNLRLFATATDNMLRKEINLGGSTIPYSIHALDNNDIAILKVEGAKFTAVPCATAGKGGLVRKLDQVMALGFPRGQNGLELGLAETSPSLGTVRKVEDTIHVTASIIPGNSGGPVFNEEGYVVGIATRIYSETLGICIKVRHALVLLEAAQSAELARVKIAERSGEKDPETSAGPWIMALTGRN